MKKRLLCILTALALCLSLLPTTALAGAGDVASVTSGGVTTDYATLEGAIAAAQASSDSTVKMLQSVELSKNIEVTQGTFTIDLNGKTVSSLGGLNGAYVFKLPKGSTANVLLTDTASGGTVQAYSKKTGIFMEGGALTVQNVTVTGGGTGIAARKGTLTLDNATVTGTTQALQSNYSNDCVMVIQNGSALSSTGDHVITMKNGTLTVKDGTFTGGAKGTIGYSQLSTNTVTVDLSALSDPTGITIYNTSSSAVSAANIILPAGYTLGTESLASKTQYSISRVACASHTLTKTEAKTPTCTEDGNSEYWTCSVCGKLFGDENGTTETTAEAVKIPAAGHSLTKTESKAPTCTEGGNSAYWTCSVCGKYFSDENGENEIAKDSWVISATGHSLTKTEDGGSEYWVCDLCGKFFSDENGTNEITPGGETYRVAGVAELCGSDWNPADDNNLMTLNADTGLYEKTYTGVRAGEYPIKVVGTRSDGTMNWYGNAQGMNVVIYVTAVCDVTVVFNATTHDIGIVGISAVEKTWMDIDAIRVVGNGDGAWLNGANWDPAADENKMTEVRPGVYEITYSRVPAGSDYQFKFAANGSWTDNWGAGGAAGEAVYNSNTNISLELTEPTDVTLRLNLNGFNESTKQGATYEVVLGSGDDTGKVAVDYLDAEGNLQTCAAATVLAADAAVWEGGWYVAQGKVTIPNAVTLSGDVHLILADECSLTAGSGIAGSGTLTVYAQSTGEQKGSLTATGMAVSETDAISAGIHAGSITVNGGAVNATGGAGEGSDITSAGLYSTPGNITINDGVVTATGGTVTGDCGESVGIATEEADIIVNGGTVNATGAASATWSIGVDADWGGFRLSGGSVTATGRDAEYDGGRTSARSIGLYAAEFAVSGGELTATSGTAAGNMPETEGISCSNARIDGGTVIAEAGAADGGSSTGISNYGAFTATGGQVIATSGAAAWSTGIDSYGDAQSFSISGDAAVEATGGESTSCSAGVYANSWDEGGTVSITDHASLLAIGKHSDAISFGVYAESTYTDEASRLHAVQVTGGDLNAICFGADENSYGIFTAMVYTPSGGEPTVQDVPGLYVSSGHVRVHNVDEGAQDHSALNAQPDLSGYGSYTWRTGMEDGFTPSTTPYEYSPTHSFVEFSAAAGYGVTVNGVEVDEVNYTDVLADGVNDGKVSYDPATNTLTVSGALTDAGYTIIPLEIAGNGTTDVVLSAESSTISAGMKVFAVKDVTATVKSGNPAFTGAVDITCSGDVTLANSGTGMTVADALTVNGAQNVAVTAAGASQVISGTTVISCSGNVSIVNSGTGMAVSASLSVTGAKDVTVTANANNPTIDGNADISCSGNVKLVNLGGGRAIGGTLVIRKTDAHGYAVKTGADLDNLTVYAEKAAGETFGPESLSASVVKTSTTHSLTKTEAKEPTCTEDGNSAYWTCSVCGKLFSDENGENEIAKDSWIIEAKGHSLTKTEAKEPTCTEDGNSEYWTCSVCGKFFSDEDGTTEIEKDSWVIKAKGHNLTKTEAKEPTCTEDGNSEYWTCSVCGKFFSDEDGTTEIEKDSWIIEAKGHSFGDWTVTKEPTCTEAGKQMRVCTVCGAVEEASVPACACPSAELTDVPQDAWYHTAVDFMVMHELMLGVDEGRFAPESTMTRAQLVTVLYRIAGEPETDGTHGFTDVADGMWYTDAIAWAVQSGVVNGIGDDKFDPDGYVTREQIATILFRYTKSEPVTQDKLSAFPDADKASSYAVDALNWAVAEGLINGSDGKLLPGEMATRAQAAAILARFLWNNA